MGGGEMRKGTEKHKREKVRQKYRGAEILEWAEIQMGRNYIFLLAAA